MKRLIQYVRKLSLQSTWQKLHRSDEQNILMARDLSRLHSNYMALLRKNSEGQLGVSSFAVIKHMTILLQLRDYETYRHGIRVARLAAILARKMGIDSAYCAMLELATPLHDIGMLALPDPCNRKDMGGHSSGIERHTTLGETILKSDDHILSIAAQLARSHHEYFDGNGLPDHLIGEEIPLEARIVAVADRFDDLLHGMHGHGPVSPTDAFIAIFEQYGKQFDPKVVRALNESLEELVSVVDSAEIEKQNRPKAGFGSEVL